ncbi:polyadenylate-binding protein-interacting protein 1 isoform X2 [Drosophila bipectinata]|nr:polyadenylate-binding protein-interacting protein 1 [Drosophila bipectinata]
MECRAPFQPDDQYEQLRRPNAGGPVGGGMPLDQQAHLYEYGAGARQAYAQVQDYQAVASGYQQPIPAQAKLSAAASIFVPRGGAPPHQRHQPQYQQQGGGGGGGGHHGQQQRYANGYKQHHHQNQQQPHHQQQSHYNHHHNHQKFNNDMHKLANSVQNRLNIGNPQATGNFYPQQVHQPNTHHHHQQQQQQSHQHVKFQRHAHLNNSFQQLAQPTHHQQQPQQHAHHQHNQQQQYFQNQNHQQQQQQQPSTSSAAASSSSSANSNSNAQPDMATIALEYLDTVIHCLNQNPGQFDAIASRFLTIFDGMENNNYVLSIAMEDIFEKSIEQPNFRYMGAKLYNLLHMLNFKPDSLFHTLLKCKLDYHQEEVTKYMRSGEQQKVRETALFLAELYMQLRGEDDSRLQLIAVNIVYSLSKLLASESNENVRCICQTLKLAGYDLTADCPKDMQDIIIALQAIEAKSPGKYPMAASVISLQQNNWGRKVSNSLGGEEDTVTEPPRLSDEPVFYGPDGRELTAEESEFLTAQDEANGSDGDDFDLRDGGDLDLDAEMDEETERAYKEFCSQQKKT